MKTEQPMDQYVRVMTAVMLCLVVIWAYQVFFVPPPAPRPATPVPQGPGWTGPVSETGPPGATGPGEVVLVPPGEDEEPLEEIPPEAILTDLEKFICNWTSKGASLESLRLKEFFETTEREVHLGLIPVVEEGARSLAVLGLSDLDQRPWRVLERGEEGRLVFESRTSGRLVVTKTITLPRGEDYHFICDLTFRNGASVPLTFEYRLRGPAGMVEEKTGYGSEPMGLMASEEDPDDVWVVSVGKVLEEPMPDNRPIAFAGVENKYFASLLAPLQVGGKKYAQIDSLLESSVLRQYEGHWNLLTPDQREKIEKAARNNVAASIGLQEMTLQPGESLTHRYLFFAGPKVEELLGSYAKAPAGREDGYRNPHFERILFRGWTGGISRFFVGVLTFIHGIVPNWGFSIIILTFIVRVVMHPLNRKAQKSMHGMSKLKPEMDKIKEKYKKRKSKQAQGKMQKEIFALYKEHKINPAGGCLPMLFQFPIFIGLYWGINQAVDLRQAPFILWIDDLSTQDALFDLGFTIPLLATSSFNLLPILVSITWVLQQKMQPKPVDPQQRQQQKIMTYMLYFMGFLFYTVPSGLNLYFVTSAALGIVESRWIRSKLGSVPGGAQGGGNGGAR